MGERDLLGTSIGWRLCIHAHEVGTARGFRRQDILLGCVDPEISCTAHDYGPGPPPASVGRVSVVVSPRPRSSSRSCFVRAMSGQMPTPASRCRSNLGPAPRVPLRLIDNEFLLAVRRDVGEIPRGRSVVCESWSMTDDAPTLFDSLTDSSAAPDGSADLQTAAGLFSLTALPGIGSGRAIKLARAFRSSDAFNNSSPDERKRVAGIAVDGFVVVREIELLDESVRLVGLFDHDYPATLRDIKDSPALLWVRGRLPDPDRRIAIVGTRSATSWGVSMAQASARDAARAGISVVSGLALGIDIAAHRAALAAGGHTTAILGSGIDKATPREHLADAEEIIDSGGCIFTEQRPGTQPSARTLVARNRLQSGLSAATIVIQCGLQSGAMSTARFAVEQNRMLAIPLPPDAERGHEENAGSLSMLDQSPQLRVLRSRDDLAALLADIR